MQYVDIIPATKTFGATTASFTYIWPENFPPAKPGVLVRIPFGHQKIYGVVLRIKDESVVSDGLKPVESLVLPESFIPEQLLSLIHAVAEEYQTTPGLILRTILPKVLKRPRKKTFVKKDPDNLDMPHPANEAQATAIKVLSSELKSGSSSAPYLLHGITGSGKTEIYLQLTAEAILQNKQALIMVPEISLTPQALERFSKRFGADRIAVWHSQMTPSEKWHNWMSILSADKDIVIGPRSAIFTPLSRLGFIAVDEEHDSSYKQYDANPRYDARKVARSLAKIHGALLVYGDATPTIETYHRTLKSGHVLSLPDRAVASATLPSIEIVDMREELKASNFSIFSNKLQDAINEELSSGGQVLLFLNRRGISTIVLCRDCGLAMRCLNCDVSLIYHKNVAGEELVCHHCGFTRPVPKKCPKCNSSKIKFLGSGTQKVEIEAKKLFPQARIGRLDRDVAAKKGQSEKVYNQFRNHEIDILIGTEMIARGWDLPNIGVVGILLADSSLHFPDYRSGERTFQLITQVAGRTGRGAKAGKVVLQTYQPESRIIQAASKHDYKSLYEAEIEERDDHSYPPFIRLVKLIVKGKDKKLVLQQATDIQKYLSDQLTGVRVIGPAPAFITRLNNVYRYQVILKLPVAEKLPKELRGLAVNIDIDVDPEDLL